MNRDEYMRQLEQELLNITEEDRNDALEYYREYFDEAGWENEQKVINELGDPRALAAQIKAQSALKQIEADPHNGRRSVKAVWMGIGAAFAAPIALPLAILFAALVILLMLTLLLLIGAFFLLAASLGASAVVSLIMAIVAFFFTPATALLLLGISLLLAGMTGLVFVPTLRFSQFAFRKIAVLVNKYVLRRERANR